MPSICAVPGCRSGLLSERKRIQKLGIKHTSLFRLPKEPNLREEWRKKLGHRFKSNDLICELHFKESDIKKFDRISLKDGSIFESPLEKYRLHPNAVPCNLEELQEQQANSDKTNCSNTMQDTNNRFFEETIEEIKVENPDNYEDEILPTIEQHYDNMSQNDGCFPDYIKCDTFSTDGDTETKEISPIVPPSDNSEWNFQSLKKDLENTVLPKGWCWSENEERNAVIFSLVVFGKLRLSCFIYENLQIKVFTSSNKSIRIVVTLSSTKDVIGLCQRIEKFQVCAGTDIESNRHSPDCCGLLGADCQARIRNGKQRCEACRKLRHSLQNRILRQQKRNVQKAKYARTMYNLNLLRKKHKRLENKVDRLKQIIERTKRKYALVKQDTQGSAISNSADAQTATTQVSSATTKLNAAKARHYDIQWVKMIPFRN